MCLVVIAHASSVEVFYDFTIGQIDPVVRQPFYFITKTPGLAMDIGLLGQSPGVQARLRRKINCTAGQIKDL